MPDDESPHSSSTSHSDHDNIYAAFHGLPGPHITISELCAQLSFILASTPNAGGAAARETFMDRFDSEWAELLSHFARRWLKQPIWELYLAGYNTSRFRGNMEETTTGRHENQPYESTPLEKSGVDLDGFNHTFDNETALRLLAIADPSFPKLLPLAANMTRRLHTIQAHARTAAESIALISSIVPQDLRSQAAASGGDESRDRLARWWTGGFDFHRWWTGDETAGGYSSAATRRAVGDMARLQRVLEAARAGVAETSLSAQKKKRPKTRGGGSDATAAWVTLGWRADCGGCNRDGPPHTDSRVVVAAATPVVVAYFVPSANTLFQGMEEAYWLLSAKKASAIRRREATLAEQEEASRLAWRKYDLEHGGGGGGAADDEEDYIDVHADEEGTRTCLTRDEVGARVRTRLRSDWSPKMLFGIAPGRD
ncbi:hypothetical protein B0T26DRAFT_757959 [Lasiosphaeria miniovina]|uniref:Uncharacterized protein n=1 Tax=Lasiosphaeria miniovina TaxID=1954250 RepID=A0AA39ZR37_9PEZI|nr:uncharacterized protein B0T26DRAFT_757959 [Lasiosphaeria miniovina]KAK0701994.1 hypothetical protein B0T26DRAFT_757959 [Lasiosphaeria miniovina]